MLLCLWSLSPQILFGSAQNKSDSFMGESGVYSVKSELSVRISLMCDILILIYVTDNALVSECLVRQYIQIHEVWGVYAL